VAISRWVAALANFLEAVCRKPACLIRCQFANATEYQPTSAAFLISVLHK
jgi:hypothetical protein